ncbi:phage head-tail joining protein [Paracoccus sulfuroxidans]|uniref:GpW protein n=1 Tax=Paracoccus sulfuroxidans TaxID=384678 RepID=A0A562NQG5_9RHOB|nr:hypothetical protein [Paracoccus sulfuroxidans]AZV00336.1 head-tail connector [Paracoccus phage vB_PsuS_Psul1]TWI34310.1 hypothetical protein IQ24_01825 [Paracoccus sulfuroxidans]
MSYTPEQLAELKANIAKGVTSLEINGEKVTFRSLDEMRRIVKMIEEDLGITPRRGGFHLPTFSRG